MLGNVWHPVRRINQQIFGLKVSRLTRQAYLDWRVYWMRQTQPEYAFFRITTLLKCLVYLSKHWTNC